MKHQVRGKVVVDFAGDYDTARAFASSHGLTIARDEYGQDGIISLAAQFQSHPTLAKAQAKLTELGWARESQTIRYTDSYDPLENAPGYREHSNRGEVVNTRSGKIVPLREYQKMTREQHEILNRKKS